MRHVARGSLGGAIPTLITMKILSGVANLRTRRRARGVLECLRRARARFETRITEFSIQHDHVHLIVETANERMLARAMKGLDPLSSAPSFDGWVTGVELAERAFSMAPRLWLLRVGWRRGGLLDPGHVPGALV